MPKNKKNHPVVTMLDELLSIPAPPGREADISELIIKKIKQTGFEPEKDIAGNVLVRLKGKKTGAPVIMAAHMDEIALVVSRIEEDGRLRVVQSGGLAAFKMGERLVDIIGDTTTIQGVVSLGSGHTKETITPSWETATIFTGMNETRLRACGIHEGASVVPIREGRGPVLMGDPEDPFIAAWTFDDRMGVIALLRLLETIKKEKITPRRTLILAFTVHEEGGCHGAKVLAHREEPYAFIAVDGCPVTPGSGLKLDGRPGVWAKDGKTCYSHNLIMAIQQAADSAGTGLQRAVYTSASSDASAVYDSGGAPLIAFFGHVRENSHGLEVSRLSVFDNVLKVLTEFLRAWPD